MWNDASLFLRFREEHHVGALPVDGDARGSRGAHRTAPVVPLLTGPSAGRSSPAEPDRRPGTARTPPDGVVAARRGRRGALGGLRAADGVRTRARALDGSRCLARLAGCASWQRGVSAASSECVAASTAGGGVGAASPDPLTAATTGMTTATAVVASPAALSAPEVTRRLPPHRTRAERQGGRPARRQGGGGDARTAPRPAVELRDAAHLRGAAAATRRRAARTQRGHACATTRAFGRTSTQPSASAPKTRSNASGAVCGAAEPPSAPLALGRRSHDPPVFRWRSATPLPPASENTKPPISGGVAQAL
jgi:hypothetical protein